MTRDWRSQAACLDEDAELFFPTGSGGLAQLQTVEAKLVCRRCPVVLQCAEWAIAEQSHGVAGGLSADERAEIRRGRGREHRTAVDRLRAAAESLGVDTAAREAIRDGMHPGDVAAALGVARDRGWQWVAS